MAASSSVTAGFSAMVASSTVTAAFSVIAASSIVTAAFFIMVAFSTPALAALGLPGAALAVLGLPVAALVVVGAREPEDQQSSQFWRALGRCIRRSNSGPDGHHPAHRTGCLRRL